MSPEPSGTVKERVLRYLRSWWYGHSRADDQQDYQHHRHSDSLGDQALTTADHSFETVRHGDTRTPACLRASSTAVTQTSEDGLATQQYQDKHVMLPAVLQARISTATGRYKQTIAEFQRSVQASRNEGKKDFNFASVPCNLGSSDHSTPGSTWELLIDKSSVHSAVANQHNAMYDSARLADVLAAAEDMAELLHDVAARRMEEPMPTSPISEAHHQAGSQATTEAPTLEPEAPFDQLSLLEQLNWRKSELGVLYDQIVEHEREHIEDSMRRDLIIDQEGELDQPDAEFEEQYDEEHQELLMQHTKLKAEVEQLERRWREEDNTSSKRRARRPKRKAAVDKDAIVESLLGSLLLPNAGRVALEADLNLPEGLEVEELTLARAQNASPTPSQRRFDDTRMASWIEERQRDAL